MKIYTKIIIIFFLLCPLRSFGTSYTDIFEQFKQSNSEYKNFELSLQDSEKSAIADRGDIDADGYDDIIFVMQKQGVEKTDKQVVPKWLVVLKGQAQGKFKTLLVNQKIAEFDNGQGCYLTVKAYMKYKPSHFNARVNCGSTMNPRIPANRHWTGLYGEYN